MKLYLQLGYGMMEHCRYLISTWGGGTVILSPRDLDPQQLPRFAGSINKLTNGSVLLDPQFYLPHSDHATLCSHVFWPDDYQTGLFWQGNHLTTLLGHLLQLNTQLGCSEIILPGRLAAQIDDDWLATQEMTIQAAGALQTELPLVATIALTADAVRNEDQIALLLERAARWDVSGYYLVCEHPGGNYWVGDPSWLANVLDLTSGLRLQGASVIIGYCNHQMLIAATAKATAIASGTWMNVRAFPPEKFQIHEEEVRTRAVWYYCPQALSEYKVPFMDIARTQGLLGMMAPLAGLDSGLVANLFGGTQPSTVGFGEQSAFRHYLLSLAKQVQNAEASTFGQTVAAHETMLDTAAPLLTTLNSSSILGQQRDFFEILDVNRAAIASLNFRHGAMLRRNWNSLT